MVIIKNNRRNGAREYDCVYIASWTSPFEENIASVGVRR